MRNLILALTLLLTASSALTAPSIIRLEYKGVATPDYLIYEVLVQQVHSMSTVVRQKDLVGWVYSEINLTFDDEIQGWLLPHRKDVRHSKKAVRKLIKHLRNEQKLFHIENIKAQKRLLCSSTDMSTSDAFTAFIANDIATHSIARKCLDDTSKILSTTMMSSIRSWIARIKPGFHGKWYKHDALWKGQESRFHQFHQALCSSKEMVL